jgi:seryl-tRNA synthetase
MLDLKLIREKASAVEEALRNRSVSFDLKKIIALDAERRRLISESESLKQKRNDESRAIGEHIKAGEDPAHLREQIREMGERIKRCDEQLDQIVAELDSLLLLIPNLPHPSVPVGKDERDDRLVKEWGEEPKFDFEPKPHWELAEQLDIIDFKRAAALSGSNFVLFKGAGAALQRALVHLMLQLHTSKHHYVEVSPPFVVNRKAMTGTGQLPKFEEDMYRCELDDLFLIPTAEVPLVNLHQGEILRGVDLPLYYCAHTPCFRREAGSYGKETRGLTRVHQFEKVELVKFVTPDSSYAELETLLADAEEVLRLLGLHYRVVELCTADLGFAAAKCYDIEVWAPAMQKYLEVSSCSNCEDFQARRANIRFKRDDRSKPEFVHTLNASGLALPRLMIAFIETCQQADGSIAIPELLRPPLTFERISPKG